jgi:hypothetical protein
MAELAQKRPVVAKIHPQASWNRENPLPVRHIGKHFIVEPMGKQKRPFLITGRTA